MMFFANARASVINNIVVITRKVVINDIVAITRKVVNTKNIAIERKVCFTTLGLVGKKTSDGIKLQVSQKKCL